MHIRHKSVSSQSVPKLIVPHILIYLHQHRATNPCVFSDARIGAGRAGLQRDHACEQRKLDGVATEMELLWSVAAPSPAAPGMTPSSSTTSSARSDLTIDILQPPLASPACEGDGAVLEYCAAVCATSPPANALCAMPPLAGLSDEEMLRAMIESEPWKELLRAVQPEASVVPASRPALYGDEYVNPLLISGQQRNAHKSLGESRCCDEGENAAGASAQSRAEAPAAPNKDKIHFVWPGPARGALDALSAVGAPKQVQHADPMPGLDAAELAARGAMQPARRGGHPAVRRPSSGGVRCESSPKSSPPSASARADPTGYFATAAKSATTNMAPSLTRNSAATPRSANVAAWFRPSHELGLGPSMSFHKRPAHSHSSLHVSLPGGAYSPPRSVAPASPTASGAGSALSSAHLASRRSAEAYERSLRTSSSPNGRGHPDPQRRREIRQYDVTANIDYHAPRGAPDNDRRMKEATFLPCQAYAESLRVYPEPGASGGTVAAESQARSQASGRPLPPSSFAALARARQGAPPPGANHYSGSTLSMRTTPSSEPIESNVRLRLGLASPELEWRENQLHGVWVVEDEASPLGRHVAKSRAKLTARLTGRRDGRSMPSAQRCGVGSDGDGSKRSYGRCPWVVTPPPEEAIPKGLWRQGAKL